MKERPIIFSGSMVNAILEGRKTMTRRVAWLEHLNEQPNDWYIDLHDGVMTNRATGECRGLNKTCRPYDFMCPYGQPGDRLWVRETWRDSTNALAAEAAGPAIGSSFIGPAYEYAADYSKRGTGWRPSIFMPRWASRITLELTAIRVERVQDISEEDSIAEGVTRELRSQLGYSGEVSEETFNFTQARDTFRILWESINAKRGYGWDSNPWVWVVEFKRVELVK